MSEAQSVLAYNSSFSEWARAMKIRPGVAIASLTDVGCQRENNEDRYGYWEPEDDALFLRLGRVAVVADGMGGHEGGQIASRIAVDAVLEIYSAAGESNPQERLLEAFREAHRRIQQQAREHPDLLGMGTTCTAFALVGEHLHFAHVGDSHLYLLRAANLRLLTRDHSLVARLVEPGMIRTEEPQTHPQTPALSASLRVAVKIEPVFAARSPVL